MRRVRVLRGADGLCLLHNSTEVVERCLVCLKLSLEGVMLRLERLNVLLSVHNIWLLKLFRGNLKEVAKWLSKM